MAFEQAAAAAPSIVSCYMMSGQDDYLITVLARDLADFERIHKESCRGSPPFPYCIQASCCARSPTRRCLSHACFRRANNHG